MDSIVKRKAQELADALVASETYQKLQEAREELDRHEAAKIMLRDFVAKQQKLQERVLAGEQPSEAEVADYQQTASLVSMNPYVRRLLEAEVAFSDMMVEVQRVLAKAVGIDLPEEQPEQEPPQQSAESQARSRLWVPGRD